MGYLQKIWLKTRWIGTTPLHTGELLRQSKQIKQGLVMGMRLAVLEEQAAAVVVDSRLASVFLPGAYQLEKDKMPPLRPDEKYDWLFPAKLYFLNLAPAPAEPWQPLEPLLTRDPERGLVQLLLIAEYKAQVKNAAVFMQNMVLGRSVYEWPELHRRLSRRLDELAISLMAHNRTDIERLDKIKERTANTLMERMNNELLSSGLVILNISIKTLEVHPQIYRLWQEQKDYCDFNIALARSIVS
ncbi:MAG: SPFH domain-containing protein [Firmicutes bacterium]|nr:SPFH domain-containing protein [Bacillota bacterium]